MTDRLWVDIETRSTVDLRNTTPYRYVEDPQFRILIGGWSTTGEKVEMSYSQDEILDVPELRDSSVLKVAHNAAFERVCFSRAYGLPTGRYLPPEEWHDTQAIAGEMGYPQSLEGLAVALGAEKKDSAGTALINLFCKPNRKGGWNGPDTHPLKWLDFVDYCQQDVYTLIDVDRRMGWWTSEMERLVYLADQRINDTGFKIDVDLARSAMKAAERNQAAQEEEVRAMTGLENPGSQPQMMKWCRSVGLKNPDLRKETVAYLLEQDLHPDVRRVLELRQELALAAPKKFSSALGSLSSDGRLRGTIRFFGAHTGRWAGRGTQPHNLPRAQFETRDPFTGKKEFDELGQNQAILDLLMGEDVDTHSLKALVRSMFLGPLTVVDYAAIEARVVAWLAGEEWALQAFREGRDIYVETAERMSTPGKQLDRFQGKVAVLALGYNGAVGSLRAMGAGGSDDDLARLVHQWRKANPRICRLWADLQNAFGDTGPVGEHLYITDSKDELGRAVHIHLPSGRAITYHAVKWERYRVTDPRTGRPVNKEGWRFRNPARPYNRIGTYGGRLTENVTQAVARDILAEALVRLVDEGHRVVGHVHDEAIVEGEELDEVERLMVRSPSWAKGLPIDGEGFVTARYRKG